jgi:hypothetical protein
VTIMAPIVSDKLAEKRNKKQKKIVEAEKYMV